MALTRSPAEVALLEARHVNCLADALLLAEKAAPQHRVHSEQRKKIRRDRGAFNAFGFRVAGERQRLPREHAELREAAVLIASGVSACGV